MTRSTTSAAKKIAVTHPRTRTEKKIDETRGIVETFTEKGKKWSRLKK